SPFGLYRTPCLRKRHVAPGARPGLPLATDLGPNADTVSRSTGRPGGADRALSGPGSEPGSGRQHLPVGGGGGAAVAAAEPRAAERAVDGRGAPTELGRERAGAGGFSGCFGAFESGRPLDDRLGQRVSGAGGGRDE